MNPDPKTGLRYEKAKEKSIRLKAKCKQCGRKNLKLHLGFCVDCWKKGNQTIAS